MFRDSKSNQDILSALNEQVYGHIQAKKALINLINRSRIRYHQRWVKRFDSEDLIAAGKCLLIGQSGTGKTHMLECLSRLLDFPLIRVDATNLNPTGASGGLKSSKLRELIRQKAKAFAATRPGFSSSGDKAIDQVVVFVDEIDKLGTSFDSGGNWNQHVQANFLTLFDAKDEFAGVSFVFSGAFNALTQLNSKAGGIGFNPSSGRGVVPDLTESIVKAGLIPELVGRLTSIVELDKFTEVDYYQILMTLVLPKHETDLKSYGVTNFELSEGELRDIAKRGCSSGQGVRSLIRELNARCLELEFACDPMSLGHLRLTQEDNDRENTVKDFE